MIPTSSDDWTHIPVRPDEKTLLVTFTSVDPETTRHLPAHPAELSLTTTPSDPSTQNPSLPTPVTVFEATSRSWQYLKTGPPDIS